MGALLRELGLGPGDFPRGVVTDPAFPVVVPEPWLARIRPGDPTDPLLLQVLPRGEEAASVPGFVTEPIAESDAMPVPGLLRKYRDRALLVATGACAIHCRYCFRRNFPYAGHTGLGRALDPVLPWLAAHPEVTELVLSGGDPLSASDELLDDAVTRLAGLGTLRRLRIHTRLPVVLPQRVTSEFVNVLARAAGTLKPVLVLHANHARELDEAAGAALARVRETGATLLNQAVLLRGVNDDVEALADLSETLFAHDVLPYYLHLLDPVAGAAHFDVPEPEARALVAALQARLPGYLVPRLVREENGRASKTVLAPARPSSRERDRPGGPGSGPGPALG